jgi:hypothetical protein
MAFNPFLAIRLTPYHAQLTGWPDYLGKVFGVLGFPTRNPTAKEFVTAVRKWQHDHPPLAADGLLGAETWQKLLPEVRSYQGRVAAGTLPDWVAPPSPTAAVPAPQNPPPPTPAVPRAAGTPEDRALEDLLKEWRSIGDQLKVNPPLAVPVSHEYVADDARLSPPSLATPGICGTLRVGQVWQGITGGDRTIVALIPGAPDDSGAVIFVTDSGQAYYQTLEAWHSDFRAGVYAGVTRSLAPLQTMLEVEAQALLGAIAATGGTGFASVVGVGAAQWVAQNRDAIARFLTAIGPIMGAAAGLKLLAPTLFDKVFWAVFQRVLTEIPESAAGNPKLIARFVGTLLVKPGQLTLKRDAAALADALAPLAKRVVLATSQAARAAPGAAKAVVRGEVSDLIQDLRRTDGALTPDDADRILVEIRKNPAELKTLIDQFRRALRALT